MDESDRERNAESVVDWEAARQMTGGDDSLLDELLELFPAESAQNLKAIRDAVERADAEALNRAAHTLKSSARLFGARALAACALTIEDVAKTASVEEAAAHLPELEQELHRVVRALQQKPEA